MSRWLWDAQEELGWERWAALAAFELQSLSKALAVTGPGDVKGWMGACERAAEALDMVAGSQGARKAGGSALVRACAGACRAMAGLDPFGAPKGSAQQAARLFSLVAEAASVGTARACAAACAKVKDGRCEPSPDVPLGAWWALQGAGWAWAQERAAAEAKGEPAGLAVSARGASEAAWAAARAGRALRWEMFEPFAKAAPWPGEHGCALEMLDAMARTAGCERGSEGELVFDVRDAMAEDGSWFWPVRAWAAMAQGDGSAEAVRAVREVAETGAPRRHGDSLEDDAVELVARFSVGTRAAEASSPAEAWAAVAELGF